MNFIFLNLEFLTKSAEAQDSQLKKVVVSTICKFIKILL